MATMVVVDALSFWAFIALPAWWFTRKALRAIRTTPDAAETTSAPSATAAELADGDDLPPVPPGYRFEGGIVYGPADEVLALIVEGDNSTPWALPVAAELMAIGPIRFAVGTPRQRAFRALAVQHYAAKAN